MFVGIILGAQLFYKFSVISVSFQYYWYMFVGIVLGVQLFLYIFVRTPINDTCL